MNEPIDFVICWVDGNDPLWIEEKKKYDPEFRNDNREIRYRDWDLLHYWFRGIEQFAPWVNKIHFITWGHTPSWLNTDHPKLNIVNHKDYIPEKHLPTFSSRPLEINLHRIEGLAEQFVFFNDDMFLLKPVKEADFFRNGKPCDIGAMDIAIHNDETHSSAEFNAVMLINKYFKKSNFIKNHPFKWLTPLYGKHLIRSILLLPWKNFTGFLDPHLPNAFLKKTFNDIWDIEHELLESVSNNKFRSKLDVTQYLFRSWQLASGDFIPRKNLGRIYNLGINHKKAQNVIEKQKDKMICLNDNEAIENFKLIQTSIKESFDAILNKKSWFEI